VDARWIRLGADSAAHPPLRVAGSAVYTRSIETRPGFAVSLPSPSRADERPLDAEAPLDAERPLNAEMPHDVARPLDAPWLRAGLVRVRRAVDRHAAYLTRLDAVLGDGDHGDNLSTGFRAVEDLLAELPDDTPPGELLRAVGHRLVATVGGASGPLYGTAFIEAGFRAAETAQLGPELIGEMLVAAADGLARRGRCTVGDKTILDTLRPAADAFRERVARGGSRSDAAAAAISAARSGVLATRPLVAKRGLALRLGERSASHLDPGAVSCLVILVALAGDD
jgi:phosphoenolpyruvate---glycerone phosphotransferase subunit DhaL